MFESATFCGKTFDGCLKCPCSHLRVAVFVMFSTFQGEMEYIFLERNFIFMDFLAVKDAGTDVI